MTPTHEKPYKWKHLEIKDGHEWGIFRNDTFQCCKLCGNVRRRDDLNKPCRGKSKLSLR